jgi:hypothetical protein
MSGPIWLNWAIVGIIGIVSIFLLFGKGGFLIAGFNTMSKEKKKKYNEKKLCKITGSGLGIITIILAISAYFNYELPTAISWIFPWGIIAVAIIIVVLGNTICKEKMAL